MSDDDARPVSKVARRTLIAGAAWAVPTVAVLSATPAFAASPALPVANMNLEGMDRGLKVHVGFINPLTTAVTLTVDVYLTRGAVTLHEVASLVLPPGYSQYGDTYVEFPGLTVGDTYSGFVSARGVGVATLTMAATSPPTRTVEKWS